MPIITLDYEDLEKLTGTDRDSIIDRIPMIGADIERLEDKSIDIEFFPDRPDLYSVEGVSRAMRGFMDIETGSVKYDINNSDVEISLDDDIKNIRPVLACAIVRGVKFTDSSIKSLMDLQESLHWGLGRDRKKVSIGVHDLSRIKPPFKYVGADPSVEFVPLDFTEPMSLEDILERHPKGTRFAPLLEGYSKYPLILDADDQVLSFPPIINGTLTMVDKNTTDLFIDVTGLSAEVYTALNIVVAALADRGGRIESVKINYPDGESKLTPDLSPEKRIISMDEVKSLVGMDFTSEEVAGHLRKMRYAATSAGTNAVEIEIPPYRADILHNYDIIEDIAISVGFDNIEAIFPSTSTTGEAHPLSLIQDNIREIMVGLGYSEVMPFTLTSEKVHFDNMRRPYTEDVTPVMHPISEDQTMIRTTLLANQLEILSLNQHHELPQRIFEVGEAIVNCANKLHLAATSIHALANFEEIREIVDSMMMERNIPYSVKPSQDPAFIEGRRADILVNGTKVGVMGEIHPQVILNFGLGQPVVGFEINLDE